MGGPATRFGRCSLGNTARGLLVVICVTAALASYGASGASAYAESSNRVHDANSWPMYGHDLSGTRWNRAETEIDASSVASLVPSWTQSGLIGVTGTPVVAGGVAYFGDWKGLVHAVKAGSGQPLWTSPLPGGAVVGSPAIDGALLLVGIGKTLYALDRRSGGIVWKAVTNANPYSQINASPVVAGDLVFQGTAQFEEVVGKAPFSFRGSIGAFNVSTGKLVWNFYTTPNDVTSGAGEGIWSTPGVDTRLGLLYVGTGQNLDSPSGPLADSLLAIHYKTGKLAWSRQFNHPDVFSTADFSGKDADIGASPNLWVARGRALVGVGSKNGTYYAMDRKSGRLVWEAHLAPGSTFGGVLASAAVVRDRIIASSNIGDPASNATTNTSVVDALNDATGHVEWTRHFAGNVFGPISAVAGVALVGTDKGTMTALDVSDGKTLWSYRAPDKVGGGASIVGGRVLWGYGFTLFSGSGQGGVISFSISASGRVQNERGGSVTSLTVGG
jgi:polyvinyl alcohol dehydrogenase (cytochrome)